MNLTAQHMLLAELLADPTDTRTNAEKAAEAGFAKGSVYRMLNKPEFLVELNRRTTEMVSKLRARAYQVLATAMERGDVNAARTVLTAAGDIGSGTNVVTNVTQSNSDEFPNRVERWTKERELATSDKE